MGRWASTGAAAHNAWRRGSRRRRAWRRGLPLALSLAVFFLPALAGAGANPNQTLTLDYRAVVAGAPVGEARVTLALGDDGSYRVRGFARSNGWMRGFSGWRNRFWSSGHVVAGAITPERFRYHEQDQDKDRRVLVQDGTLQVTKNGRQRPRRRAPDGPDLIAALFVVPDCSADRQVHTGRHRYRLDRLPGDESACRFRVTDDDQDTFELEMELERRGDLALPRRITVRAWLTGWIELVAVRDGDVLDQALADAAGR